MAESLRCSPATISTLLIDYTPIQSKKFKKNYTCIHIHINTKEDVYWY